MTKTLLKAIFIFGVSFGAIGTEIDHYTTSHLEVMDSTKELNEYVNKELQNAIASTNEKESCSQDSYSKVADELVSNFQGLGWRAFPRIETKITSGLSVDQKVSLSQNASIYRYFGFSEGIAAGLGVACCSDLVKVNNVRVGTDKLGHFFLEGYYFYLEANKKRKSHLGKLEEKLLSQRAKIEQNSYNNLKIHSINQLSEKNLFGHFMTGVYSYGDKVSNFEGTKFWNKFLSSRSDYLECRSGKLRLKKKFNWADFVNPMWDESINCNSYKTKKGRSALKEGLMQSEYHTCPRDPKSCELGIDLYGKDAKYLLHPNCLKLKQ